MNDKVTLRESEPRTRTRPDESDVGDDLTRHRRDTVRQVRSTRVSFYTDRSDFKTLKGVRVYCAFYIL